VWFILSPLFLFCRQESWDARSTETSAVLQGVGCSAGQVQGTVRVIHSLAESAQVKPGDILVTRYTNPSWTPLFSLVVAVILEDGGMLSHAAVVARECGIACVVQVKGACTQLRSGAKAVVDGTQGTISVL
jgi:phosphoenolpyruvate synthase/pyruvate phosphate dikinase